MLSDIETQVLRTFDDEEADIIIDAIREELSNPENSSIQFFLGAIILAALGLYRAEKDGDGPISTFGDALWSAFNAVSAVGESGCPPTSSWGRLINASLILFGTPIYERVQARIALLVNRVTSGSAADGASVKAPAVTKALKASDSLGAGPAFREALIDLGTSLAKTQGLIAKIEAATAANRRTLSKLSEHEVLTEELLEKMNTLQSTFERVLPPLEASEPSVPPAPQKETTVEVTLPQLDFDESHEKVRQWMDKKKKKRKKKKQ